MTFADVKADNYDESKNSIIACINDAYQSYRYLLKSNLLTDGEKEIFRVLDEYVSNPEPTKTITNEVIFRAVKGLASCLNRYYGQKVIILLDEYDTPMQEAYVHGYWDEFTSFIRSFFNSTFKTNPYMERAIMTGITLTKETSSSLDSKKPRQVSEMDLITRFKKTSPSNQCQESIFSDLNNLTVITTTSERYADCFGFTEKEVFQALDDFDMGNQKKLVKTWYDGFTFGNQKDIYNPWSITNYLKEKQLRPYWAQTSSNGLINKLLQKSSPDIKEMMEELLNDRNIVVNFDEQIVFDQLEQNKNAIWSLMLASGYLKIQEIEYRGMLLTPWYHLCVTNLETMSMFYSMFQGWFHDDTSNYNEFINALLNGNVKEMNAYMNDIALTTFSSFDAGKHPSGKTQPERFYHGFVLGLLVDLKERYEVKSNRESGYGRYDVMLIPTDKRDKKKSQIRHYGFAFEGKKVLIDGN